MKTFSEKVREARTLRDLNQAQLARLIGVSARTIVSYETSEARPHPATLKKLAEALGVSERYLCDDQVTNPTEGMAREDYMNKTRAMYGAKAAREIDFLMERNSALFAGGEISQEAKDAYFEAVMEAYLACKADARKKYGHGGRGGRNQ